MMHDTLRPLFRVSLGLACALFLVLPCLAQDAANEGDATSDATLSEAAADVAADASAAGLENSPAESPRRARHGELVRVFSDLTVAEGETIYGDAICIGGDATVKGRVTGDLVVVLGSLDLSGEVDGGAVVVLSDAVYRESARVGRELVHVMGDIDDRGADLPPGGVRMELFGSFETLVLWLASAELLIMLVVFVIFALAGSRRVAFMSEQVVVRYGMALLIGALIHIGITIVNVTLVLTIIGIPVAILLDLVFRVLRMYGRTAVLHALGAGVGRSFGRKLSVLGGVLLGFFGLALVTLIPLFFGFPGLIIAGLVSMLIWVVIDCPAVGILALTKLGDLSIGTTPAAPPAAPVARASEEAT